MRFTLASVVLALAGSALSAPIVTRSLVGEVGSVVGSLQDNVPSAQVEVQLQGLLGNELSQIESALGGIPLADKLLSLLQSGDLSANALTAVGEALAMLKQGTPLDTVNSYLNAVTGGVVGDLGNTLGVKDLVGLLGGALGGVGNIVKII
ncbi:hypothetical protein JDV02_002461 [Purpureocillium takamizusanense]|uniref:Uncharacterized protein n=1 Tax=Purpureocillium takamizusanense TaxID=2060973 RepID=A0A9Q8V7G4_9HYPO|nr:uncharacterized protein JDV02_002461 [Purpureocillium takamizusanense]UNI15980.1 hypothetical protein JDV02_002461 [Purpureocillium takamizusanense]